MQIRNFFENFYDAVYQHTRKLYWPSMVINIITTIVLMAAIVPLVLNMFPQEMLNAFMNGPQDMETMKENTERIEEYFKENMGQFLTFYIGFMILAIVLGSYSMLTGYTISKSMLEGEGNWFSHIIRPDWSKMARIMGLFTLLMVVAVLMFIGSAAIVRLHFLLWFVFLLLLAAVFSRFAISAPAIVIADMGIMESIRYSWSRLNTGKGFKILFFAFVASIATVIVAIIISLILGLIFGNGLKGQIVSNSVLLFVNAAVYALFLAGSAGLLYRYGDFEDQSEVSLTEPPHSEQPDML